MGSICSMCSNCSEFIPQTDRDTNKINDSQYTIMNVENESEINDLIKKLDEDAFSKVKKLSRSPEGNVNLADAIISIMQEGANEFKQKTGRNMSYGEMRAAYG